MTHEDTTGHLAGGLPAFFPSSPNDENYLLMEAIADEFDKHESHIHQVDTLTTVQTISRDNIDFEGDVLTVESGERYEIQAGTIEEYFRVEVEGTLVVSGTLRTTELTGSSGDVHIYGDGTIAILTVGEYIGLDALHELGKLVQVTPQANESLERYRTRVIAEFSLSSNKGTIEDVLQTAALILEVRQKDLVYEESVGGENGAILITIPQSAVQGSKLTESEIAKFLDRLIAAGYRIDTAVRGTFEHISVSGYNNNNHDAQKGYDGLDANGDPKNNGGTYAGVIS